MDLNLSKEKKKYYYVPVKNGTLTVGSVSTTFLTSIDPDGIFYDTDNFTAIDETFTKGDTTFTTYGIGSGLIGIDETPPTPPTPPTSEPISWWWVLIFLVILFIVIGVYIYFFKYDHWPQINSFSKEL